MVHVDAKQMWKEKIAIDQSRVSSIWLKKICMALCLVFALHTRTNVRRHRITLFTT
jgi:hypothetical protein